ncbi:MAG: aldehyde reductase [Parvibaculum sp.]|uniref:SDR family oxidoreductase n=1 Tax=Parvibaculum sp. TaxID=2024848 RepID=UPI0032EE0255
MSTVLVTGGSGFIGSHCILQLLEKGHEVRTTVRNLAREPEVREMLKAGGAAPGSRLSFFAADLMSDAGWAEAAAGCDYMLHVASPIPPGVPKDENELIVPARDGALRALRAARDAGVKRVVLTSSFAAIGYGHPVRKEPFDETDWTNLDGDDISPYTKSKAVAERAAWDFMAREGGALELAVVNPVGVLGPVLGPDYSASILIVKGLMDGAMPGCPKLGFGLVDVRDVADLHLRAMTDPAAKGERFLAISGDCVWMRDVALHLKQTLPPALAKKVPARQLPNWLVFLAALRMPEVKVLLPELGKEKHATGEKAKRLLGWDPIPWQDAATATAESLMKLDA